MGVAQREVCFLFQKNKQTKLLILFFLLIITVAEVAQHMTVCDATGGCLNRCHGGLEWLCRENKTLERERCVCVCVCVLYRKVSSKERASSQYLLLDKVF